MFRGMKKNALLVSGVAAVACVVAYITFLSLPLTPEKVFRRILMKPIPKSVRIIEERHVIAMDHAFWVLHFEIATLDLNKLLDSKGFVPVNETEEFKRWDQDTLRFVTIQKHEYLQRWMRRTNNTLHLEINLSKDCQIFIKDERNEKKRIYDSKYVFIQKSSDSADIVFVADFL